MVPKLVSPYTFPGLKFCSIHDANFPYPNEMSVKSFKTTKEDIVECVTDEYGVTLDVILSKTRLRPVVDARHVLCALMRRRLKMTLSEIGEFLQDRDHTTVRHGVQMFNNRYETEEVYREKVDRIYSKLSLKHLKLK